MTFTRRTLVLATLAAFTALWLPLSLTLSLVAAVLLVAAVDAWQVRGVPELTQEFSPILSRGVPSEFAIKTVRYWHRIRLRQPAIPTITVQPQEADHHLQAVVVAGRRGTHRLPMPATMAVGPFGLGAWIHRTGAESQITVFPDMPAARHLASSVRLGLFREEGKRSRGPLGLGTEFESIREYRPDDDIRQINWRASSKLGIPMSNQYRIEQDRDVICLLDCGRLMSPPVGDRSRLDVAVDAVAAIAAVADQAGDRVGVVAFDRSIRRMLRPRRDGGRAVVQAIHDLEPSNVDSDFELAFRTILASKRAFVLVMTDLVDESAARPLLSSIPVLARKHAIAVASVIDPDLDAMITTPGSNLGDVMRSSTALRFLGTKEQVSAALTHRGVQVIEAEVESFSARCVGAYLRAKRSARL